MKQYKTLHSKNNILIIKPEAGLGNRIRAISSFIYLKNLIDADLQVVWEPDRTLNADFEYLFQPNPHFTLLNAHFKYRMVLAKEKLLNSRFGLVRNLTNNYNKLVRKIVNVDALLLNNEVSDLEHVKKVCNINRKVLIVTSGQCIQYAEGVRSFEPSDRINLIIENTASLFKNKMIGMHIRRTDHKISTSKSPLYLFENKIDEYLKNHDNVGVFLATDDPDVERYFKDKYSGVVFTHIKSFRRDTTEGMKDAVVDMFLLSKTEKIYGSYWSSYSNIASLLGNIELESLHV
jgi:hypothetical protein